MEDRFPREDFLDRIVAVCRLLDIDAPPDQEGDVIAYQLDLDEVRFELAHSMHDRPDTFLARCPLGKLPPTDREASLTYLLQTNASLGQRGLGALGLDQAGEEVGCVTRIDLTRKDEAVLATLLEVRDAARAWGQRFWPSPAEQAMQNLMRR